MAERRDPDKRLARQLARRRPSPSREFSLALEDRLHELGSAGRRPPHLWSLVIVYLVCGFVLLALALAGALGSGPLG